MAALRRAFFDDSADANKEKYVIAGGVFANYEVWNGFNKRWKAALHEPPAIEWFHTKEWRSLTEQFGQFRDPNKWPIPTGRQAANAKRDKLKVVIENSRLVAMGIGVLVEDYRLVRGADPRAADYFREDPYEGALQSFVYESAVAVRRVDPLGQIGYLSDDSSKAHIYSAVYADFKEKNPNIAKMMRGLVHLDDKKWPGLQAADMIANITNQVFKIILDKPIGDRSKLLESLPELEGSFFKIAHWDKRYMCGILLDTIGLDLYEQLGIERRKHKSDDELWDEKQKRFR